MFANIIQPPANEPVPTFGGSRFELLSTVQQNSTLILGMPAIARSTAIAARSLGLHDSELAFLGLPKDWADQEPTRAARLSVFDMSPLNLGQVLRPLIGRADFLDEMMDDTRV
jgi:hypothetical protein